VERCGRSKGDAERKLAVAFRDRTGPHQGSITAETRFREVAEAWFARIVAAVEQGRRSPGTAERYRWHLDRIVLPGLGELRVREVSVSRVDVFLAAVRDNTGTATARACRSVVSGVLGVAVRHGALTTKPTREAERIEVGPRRAPRALTSEECVSWLAKLEADPVATRKDLPDLTRFMLATGVRIGETLAVYWPEVDLDAGMVDVSHTVIRLKGQGLIRKRTKTAAGDRTLALPSWAVAMLRRRREATEDEFGPVFPDSLGGLRDPSNTRRDLRDARGSEDFAWVTSHVFRKTAATVLDEAGLSARKVADQLGHARPSMTQDVYLGRKVASWDAADALEGLFDVKSRGSVGVERGRDLEAGH
jgi:integrase